MKMLLVVFIVLINYNQLSSQQPAMTLSFDVRDINVHIHGVGMEGQPGVDHGADVDVDNRDHADHVDHIDREKHVDHGAYYYGDQGGDVDYWTYNSGDHQDHVEHQDHQDHVDHIDHGDDVDHGAYYESHHADHVDHQDHQDHVDHIDHGDDVDHGAYNDPVEPTGMDLITGVISPQSGGQSTTCVKKCQAAGHPKIICGNVCSK